MLRSLRRDALLTVIGGKEKNLLGPLGDATTRAVSLQTNPSASRSANAAFSRGNGAGS
jgi:hypothetical protein